MENFFCHLLPTLSPILPSAYISTGKLGLRRRRGRRRRRNWVPNKVWVSITPFPFHPPRGLIFRIWLLLVDSPPYLYLFHRLPDAFKNAKKRFRISCFFLGGDQELGNQARGSLPDDSWVKNFEPFFLKKSGMDARKHNT